MICNEGMEWCTAYVCQMKGCVRVKFPMYFATTFVFLKCNFYFHTLRFHVSCPSRSTHSDVARCETRAFHFSSMTSTPRVYPVTVQRTKTKKCIPACIVCFKRDPCKLILQGEINKTPYQKPKHKWPDHFAFERSSKKRDNDYDDEQRHGQLTNTPFQMLGQLIFKRLPCHPS